MSESDVMHLEHNLLLKKMLWRPKFDNVTSSLHFDTILPGFRLSFCPAIHHDILDFCVRELVNRR